MQTPQWYLDHSDFEYPQAPDEVSDPLFQIDNTLREKLRSKLKTFIPQPPASFDMYQKLNNPDTSPGEYAKIATQDPFFVARILKTVNSAIFGLRNPITEVGRAVVFLGYHNIRSLALAHCMQSREIMKEIDIVALKEIWVHSAVVSATAASLAKHYSGINANEIATVGLLHDMGRILVNNSPMKKNLDRLPEQLPLCVIESLCGSIFAESWGLPSNITLAIEYAPYPGLYHLSSIPESIRKTSSVLYLSNLLANLYGFKDQRNWAGLSEEVIAELALEGSPDEWMTPEMTLEVDKAMAMFQYF